MKLQEAFLLADVSGRHLWVVIYAKDDQYVIVNLTSKKPGCDESCIIQPGEHPFVKRETVANYQMLRQLNKWEATIMDSRGRGRSHQAISEQLLKRIQEGAVRSKFTKQGAKRIIKALLEPEKKA